LKALAIYKGIPLLLSVITFISDWYFGFFEMSAKFGLYVINPDDNYMYDMINDEVVEIKY
jgi:hypothetical protein